MGTETCTSDRPTEVSVIKFVSRNQTIEEIAPKKETYSCKQPGCGKIFITQDEYKNHEILEALKIRFICREPGCGKELPDPGSMWRHYQEWHNEANVFACPYSNCSSTHASSENLEEHIEVHHRQPPTLPTEPEIICFVEGSENITEDDISEKNETEHFKANSENHQRNKYSLAPREREFLLINDSYLTKHKKLKEERRVITKAQQKEDYSLEFQSSEEQIEFTEKNSRLLPTKLPKNEDLLITKEDFLTKYEVKSGCNEDLKERRNVIFVNGDITITTNYSSKIENPLLFNEQQEVDLKILEKASQSEAEYDLMRLEDANIETNLNYPDDEEYTPKKQRMSRCKQELYRCEVNGCGKIFKYISHYRLHHDSHKLVTSSSNVHLKSSKLRFENTSTVSFYQCRTPGCGARTHDATSLFKHYHDLHANSKSTFPNQSLERIQEFRCDILDCDSEFSTSVMLHKHYTEVHGGCSTTLNNSKTVNDVSFSFSNQLICEETTVQENSKTESKVKHNISDFTADGNENPLMNEKSRD